VPAGTSTQAEGDTSLSDELPRMAFRVRYSYGEPGDRRTIAAMRTAMWPWWVFPAIVGLVVGFLTDDMPLGWYALTFGGALFLTMVALGFYQGKTRWQQKKRAADAEAPAVHENR